MSEYLPQNLVVNVEEPVVGVRKDMYIRPRFVPPFARQIGELASEIGYADATANVFEDANIAVELDGEVAAGAGEGMLVVGDHSQRIEPLLAQTAMSKLGREASQVVAMPISYAGRLMQSTEAGKDLIIPVVPSKWAAENKIPLRDARNVLRRSLYPHVLDRPLSDLKAVNRAAITTASEQIAKGGTVTIFPSGGSARGLWRNGAGQILHTMSPEAQADTHVVGLHPEQFSVKQVMASLMLRDMGIKPKKQTLVLGVHSLGRASELVSGTGDPAETTMAIRQQYVDQF